MAGACRPRGVCVRSYPDIRLHPQTEDVVICSMPSGHVTVLLASRMVPVNGRLRCSRPAPSWCKSRSRAAAKSCHPNALSLATQSIYQQYASRSRSRRPPRQISRTERRCWRDHARDAARADHIETKTMQWPFCTPAQITKRLCCGFIRFLP